MTWIKGFEEAMLKKVAHAMSKAQKQFSNERLKALGATTFEGTINLTDT